MPETFIACDTPVMLFISSTTFLSVPRSQFKKTNALDMARVCVPTIKGNYEGGAVALHIAAWTYHTGMEAFGRVKCSSISVSLDIELPFFLIALKEE